MEQFFNSRQIKRHKYEVIVEFKPNNDEISSILGWVCYCLTGNRTCGCCSDIAALIYYFSYAKHQPYPLKRPGHSLDDIIVVIDNWRRW